MSRIRDYLRPAQGAGVVGEHFDSIEAPAARRGGGFRRENVGMSSHNPNEKLEPRKSKVSEALAINLGLGGPKAMAKAAADGQTVNIPSLPCVSMERRRVVGVVDNWFSHPWPKEVRLANPADSVQSELQAQRLGREFTLSSTPSTLPRKTSKIIYMETVPETDTGG